jgi:hypothetical protein
VKVAFEVFEHGILERRLLEEQTEDDEDWKTGHPLVFPGMLRIGGGGLSFLQIRVPFDDAVPGADGPGRGRARADLHLPRPVEERLHRVAAGEGEVRRRRGVPARVPAARADRYSPIRTEVAELFGDTTPWNSRRGDLGRKS